MRVVSAGRVNILYLYPKPRGAILFPPIFFFYFSKRSANRPDGRVHCVSRRWYCTGNENDKIYFPLENIIYNSDAYNRGGRVATMVRGSRSARGRQLRETRRVVR